MDTFEKIVRNTLTAFMVTIGICAIALVIEFGIYVADWFHAEHNFKISMPWTKQANKVTLGEQETTYKNIHHLSILCANYDLSIVISNEITDIKVRYTSNTGKISIKPAKDTLTITQKKSYDLYHIFKKSGKKTTNGTIQVILPIDYALSELSLSLGSGNTSIGKISTENFFLEGGKGSIFATGFYAKEAHLTTSKGNTKLENVMFDKVSLQGGTGEILCSGHIYESGDFHIADGNLTLLIYAPRNYYGLKVEKGEGDILIDGSNYEDVPLTEQGSHTISVANENGNCNMLFQPQ